MTEHECPVCAAQKQPRNKTTDRPTPEALARLEARPRGESTFIPPPGEPIKIVDVEMGTSVGERSDLPVSDEEMDRITQDFVEGLQALRAGNYYTSGLQDTDRWWVAPTLESGRRFERNRIIAAIREQVHPDWFFDKEVQDVIDVIEGLDG